MNDNRLISLIISTYNRPDALALVLAGCARQTDLHFEIIIADDGSTDNTRAMIEQAAAHLPIPVEHVWHPDEGFRAAAIRNKGILRARGDYLIFLDGDCVPQSDFIAQHRQLASPGAIVTGSRILLGPSLTEAALRKHIDIFSHNFAFWCRQRIHKQVNKILPLFVKLRDLPIRHTRRFEWRGIKSCNLAAWAKDVKTINGFDETFVGWGHEDADFAVRLHNVGITRRKGFFATEVLHLWHPEQPRDNAEPNRQRVIARLANKCIKAERGLAQLNE